MLSDREESWVKHQVLAEIKTAASAGYNELDRLKRARISGHNDLCSEDIAAVNRLRLSLSDGMDSVELERLQAAADALYGVLEHKLRRKRAEVEAATDKKTVDKSVWRSL